VACALQIILEAGSAPKDREPDHGEVKPTADPEFREDALQMSVYSVWLTADQLGNLAHIATRDGRKDDSRFRWRQLERDS